MSLPERDRLVIESAADLRGWLLENHNRETSIWLVTSKKVIGDRYVSRDEVLDELIAFGWIDGVRHAVDETTTMQLISPRRTRPWAKSYKDRAERLTAAGTMHPAGMATVNLAKISGAWTETTDVDFLIVPDDVRKALDGHGRASEFFDAFPPSTRRNILRWINAAKTTSTREKRVLSTAREAAHNRRVASHG